MSEKLIEIKPLSGEWSVGTDLIFRVTLNIWSLDGEGEWESSAMTSGSLALKMADAAGEQVGDEVAFSHHANGVWTGRMPHDQGLEAGQEYTGTFTATTTIGGHSVKATQAFTRPAELSGSR